jgi:predicted GIY-YIG superfamily endonuclease/mevalonate kinase
MPIGYVYILECSDGSFYTGSTIDLVKRLDEHQSGNGANHTKKRLPVTLVFVQEFQRIDDAFHKEKQIQGWSRNKKIALIEGNYENLKKYAECMNGSYYKEWLRLRSATENRQDFSTENLKQPDTRRKTTNSNENPISNEKAEFKLVAERSGSHGKLLLTAEYVVLDGALSLAVPTKYGQSLGIETIDKPILDWKSFDEKGRVWFEHLFSFDEIASSQAPRKDVKYRLIQILNAAKQLNPDFLNPEIGLKITTKLDFPRNWGLGTSSTLINNIAQWAQVDAYKLLELTFGGSGYDIACAQNNNPITYQLVNRKPIVKQVDFNPSFKDNLYFVYLNKKQNSRDGIAHYKANKGHIASEISEIGDITSKIINCSDLEVFEKLIHAHEGIISKITKQTTVKSLFFNDFGGSIKSLGAWGGDFILVTSKNDPTPYFKKKGLDTIIPYNNMVL